MIAASSLYSASAAAGMRDQSFPWWCGWTSSSTSSIRPAKHPQRYGEGICYASGRFNRKIVSMLVIAEITVQVLWASRAAIVYAVHSGCTSTERMRTLYGFFQYGLSAIGLLYSTIDMDVKARWMGPDSPIIGATCGQDTDWLEARLSSSTYKKIFTAPCYSNGAVLPSYGVCPSVRPSVRLSVCL